MLGLTHWRFDLQGTGKMLMIRLNISEPVLGIVIAGVERTYGCHSYAGEKRDALEKLAAMIERIINPLPSNVEKLGDHRAGVQS